MDRSTTNILVLHSITIFLTIGLLNPCYKNTNHYKLHISIQICRIPLHPVHPIDYLQYISLTLFFCLSKNTLDIVSLVRLSIGFISGTVEWGPPFYSS